MKETQFDFVKKELKEKGYITRNECLSKFISRLGAIIHSLKKEGWQIDGEHYKTLRGNDYKYNLLSPPECHATQKGQRSFNV